MPSGGQVRGTNWIFTVNNPHLVSGGSVTDEAYEDLQFRNTDTLSYCVWQLEMGEQGTRHLQGWLVLTTRTRLSAVKALSPYFERAHFEVQRGSNRDAYDYVTKDRTRIAGPWTFGDCPNLDAPSGRRGVTTSGGRGDVGGVWDSIRGEILSGKRVGALLESGSIKTSGHLRLAQGLQQYRLQSDNRERGPQRVIVLTGPTGCGKSRIAFSGLGSNGEPLLGLAVKPYFRLKLNAANSSKWWDGYAGQERIILDDFSGKEIDMTTILHLLDRYPETVETKGSFERLESKEWIITSNLPICNWYAGEYRLPALARRITEWFKWDDEVNEFFLGYPDSGGEFKHGVREQ